MAWRRCRSDRLGAGRRHGFRGSPVVLDRRDGRHAGPGGHRPAVSATISAAALELADGVFRAMILAKLKLAASFVVAAAVFLAVGTVLLMSFSHSHARDGQDEIALVSPKPQRGSIPPRLRRSARPEARSTTGWWTSGPRDRSRMSR